MQVSSAPAAESNQKRKSIWILVLSSFTCWLIVCLLGLNWFIQAARPLQYIKTKRFVPLDQNPLVSKIPAFFNCENTPQVLVLGSSLPMNAIARCDAAFTGKFDQCDLNATRTYTNARYLEHLIKEKTGIEPSIYNLACPACMASDAELILRRSIEAGRTPKVVIYGIFPRDFSDNLVSPFGKTPIFQTLSDRMPLAEICNSSRSFLEGMELLLGQVSYLYRVRGDYKTMLTGIACDMFGHPADLFEFKMLQQLKNTPSAELPIQTNYKRSAGNYRQRYAKPVNQFGDLTNWAQRYQPADFVRFEKEKVSFKSFLTLCKQKNIHAIVVSMPVTAPNLKLIPSDFYKRYKDEICTMPEQFGAEMVDLAQADDFANCDFYDSAHMNAQGGRKWQEKLISSVKELRL